MPIRSLKNRNIALVEDDLIMGESLIQSLAMEGLAVRWWRSGREALEHLPNDPAPDAVVCDIRLPDMSGEELFGALSDPSSAAKPGWVPPPFLFMTAYADIDQAVRLMRAGAADYVTKPFEMMDFLERLASLLPEGAEGGEAILGVSETMREIERFVRRIAPQSAPVLITGETGVGKEVCARYLHSLSRPDAPFIAVNCAAIPADLLESEIFGHEKGAFTGAGGRHLGYAERARDGVLFLDEIAEMPAALQVKLLRLIEDRAFYRVGGETLIPLRARVVAATNQDIRAAVASGAFREDLFYRLDVFRIEIPPLRSRPEDVEWLLDRFVRMFSEGGGRKLCGVSMIAVEAARAHDWPGNVRELRNRVERAVALASGAWLVPTDLFPRHVATPCGETAQSLSHIRDAAERRAIESALRSAAGQIQEAARILKISRTTLWEKMKRLGIERCQ